jgi:hypothetical protein
MTDWSPQLVTMFVFGVAFVITLLVLAIKFPAPTSFQPSFARCSLWPQLE